VGFLTVYCLREVSQRARILAFGSAAALVLVGVAGGALVGGVAGEVLAIVLVSAGLGGAVLLIFLEVGLSEEREHEREEQRRRRRGLRMLELRRGRLRRRPRRPR
jgi:hypothetical protein